MFIGDLLKYTLSWTILATTWESFSTEVNTKEVELLPLTTSESEELLLSRYESVHGMESSSISSDQLQVVLKCCSGIPQLLRNAVFTVNKVGFETFASDLACSTPERRLNLLCPSNMSPNERFDQRLGICFDRLQGSLQTIIVTMSVLPGFFTLDEAATVFKGIGLKEGELRDGLTDLMNFSFLSYDQKRKAYYFNPAIRSFVILKATQEPPNTPEMESSSTDLRCTYKNAIRTFVHYTFGITLLNIRNSDFFSTSSGNVIQRYREQEANLREIGNWFISNRLSKDPEMEFLRLNNIESYIRCYMVNINLMETNLLKTILSWFSRFCSGSDDSKNENTDNVTKKQYIENLTYEGVTSMLGCRCVPQLCPVAQKKAKCCFIKVLKELCISSQTISSLSQQLQIVSKCKIMSKEARAQFLLKYGMCLVWQGQKGEGLEFVKKGIGKRKKVFTKSKSTKDRVLLAASYDDLSSKSTSRDRELF